MASREGANGLSRHGWSPDRGRSMGPSGIRRDFNFVLKKAGMRRIRFHDIRHTYASLLPGDEESLGCIKEQMGHSSIQMTVDTYGHLVPGSNRRAVNRLADPIPTSPSLMV